uniref:PIK helical domain-containing protein n=1 Tax=Brugia timori TaxID=42155 RepID=A0A0R3QYL7_9BILA
LLQTLIMQYHPDSCNLVMWYVSFFIEFGSNQGIKSEIK